ncbi:hypothetical protein [Sporosarcina sp. P20a]|uniref:hypothetical protein n=1 Tax=Sporosarcina sp. P20a TaxID=2048256 RepID=UPI0013046AB2|nr:hypothetical protein [Sporosarcina sp. P20a]
MGEQKQKEDSYIGIAWGSKLQVADAFPRDRISSEAEIPTQDNINLSIYKMYKGNYSHID